MIPTEHTQPEHTQQFLTAIEVAQRMRVSRNTVLEMLNRGELPATKFGNQWRIWPSDLDSYLKARHNQRPQDNK